MWRKAPWCWWPLVRRFQERESGVVLADLAWRTATPLLFYLAPWGEGLKCRARTHTHTDTHIAFRDTHTHTTFRHRLLPEIESHITGTLKYWQVNRQRKDQIRLSGSASVLFCSVLLLWLQHPLVYLASQTQDANLPCHWPCLPVCVPWIITQH